MNNFPPQRPRRPQQGPQQFAPVNVLMGLIQQSKTRYAAISEMLRRQDEGFRQLDLEATQMAQLMMSPTGEADPKLHSIVEGLQAAKRAGMIVHQNLEQQLEAEKFLCAELMRWVRGQRPIQMPDGVQTGNAPAITPPATAPAAQLGQAPAPVLQQRVPQPQQQAPGAQPPQMQPPAPSYFQQTPYGLDASAPPPPNGGPSMFGPYPGMPQVPFQPAPPESLPVTQLPVTQVPFDPNQPAFMPPPVQAQQYASPEAARAAIPGPPPPVVQTPAVVQFTSPEAAKSAIEASHANNVPAVSVPQANGQMQQKPVS